MKKAIPSLNGLRAISIGIVILSHIMHRSLTGVDLPFPFWIFRDGGFGVNVFFVISGFLITKLLLEEEELNGKISLKDFYARRALRIFPAYYFLLLIYFLLQWAHILWFSRTSWLTSLFYMKYLGGGDWESGHFWSLSVEEHFYLFWPVMFKLSKNGRTGIALTVIAAVMFFRLNIYFKWLPYSWLMLQETLFLRADALMIGCLTALHFRKIIDFVNKRKYFEYLVPVIVLLIAFCNSDMLTNLNYSRNLHLGFILVPLGMGTSNGLPTNVFISLLMIVSIHFKGTYWFAFLNTSLMNYIGKLSYSLYLWQQLFFSEKVGVFGKLPLNLVMIALTALFSYHFIEKPFLRIKDKFHARKTLAV